MIVEWCNYTYTCARMHNVGLHVYDFAALTFHMRQRKNETQTSVGNPLIPCSTTQQLLSTKQYVTHTLTM